jgi:hypothetical protein
VAVQIPNRQLSPSLPSSILAAEVSVMAGTPEGEYRIPILANVSESSKHPVLKNVIANTGYAMKRADLVINVDEPLTIEQHVTNFLQTWGPLVTFALGLGVGRILESVVINKFKKSSSIRSEKTTK